MPNKISSLARLGRVVVPSAGALALLTLLWLSMPPVGHATLEVGAEKQLSPAPSTPVPDPRWLSLVRSTGNPPSVALQSAMPSINVNLTDGFVAGHVAAPVSVAVSVTRGADRVAYASVTPVPDAGGFFYIAYPWSYGYGDAAGGGGCGGGCSPGVFQAGDVVWVEQAGTVISLTIPALSGLAAPEADTVYGAAPANEAITVYLFPFAAPYTTYTQTAAADANGSYAIVLSPTVDLRPRDTGYVVHTADPGRQVYARFVAPFLRAQVFGSEVSGMAAPNSSVGITVADSSGVLVTNLYAYAGVNGSFEAYSDYYTSGPIIRPTDQITAIAARQTFAMAALTVTAHSDQPNGRVTGEALAGQRVEVLSFRGPVSSSYYNDDSIWDETPAAQTIVTAEVTGQYTATLSLAPADYGAAILSSPEGYQTYARFATPYLWVRLGQDILYEKWWCCSPWLTGQLDNPGPTLTVTVQGPSGYRKGQPRIISPANSGYFAFYNADEPLALDTGDVITLTTPRGVQIVYTLPLLTAEADSQSAIVSGLAPPGAQLTVSLSNTYWPPPTLALVVTATAQGEYTADFSSVGGFPAYASGMVKYTTPEGYTIVRTFPAPQASCQPGIGSVQVGGNSIYVSVRAYNCPGATVRLRNAQGQVKAQMTMPPGITDMNWMLYDPTGQPIPVQPGDTIETVLGGWVATPTPYYLSQASSSLTTITVPPLTTVLDPAANMVTGQATPGIVLSLALVTGPYKSYLNLITTTVSAQGIYTAHLTGIYTLTPGDRVQVSGPANFYAYGIFPTLKATLYQGDIEGMLPPLAPYTLTVSPATAIITGYASTDGSFFATTSPLRPDDNLTLTLPDQVYQMTLVPLTASLDRATAMVTGHAPPNSRLKVTLGQSYYGWEGASQIVTTTATGAYTASFPSLIPAQYAQGSVIHFDANGNQTILNFASTHWNVTLGSTCVNGTAETPGQPITLTLQPADGSPTSIYTLTASYGAGAYTTCSSKAIQAGDQLTLTTPTGVATLAVPNLTAQHDYARQVLEGQALPNSAIAATFGAAFFPYYTVPRRTQADGSGHYGMDTSDLGLLPGQSGTVTMTDEHGNTIQAGFTISGYRVYLPLVSERR